MALILSGEVIVKMTYSIVEVRLASHLTDGKYSLNLGCHCVARGQGGSDVMGAAGALVVAGDLEASHLIDPGVAIVGFLHLQYCNINKKVPISHLVVYKYLFVGAYVKVCRGVVGEGGQKLVNTSGKVWRVGIPVHCLEAGLDIAELVQKDLAPKPPVSLGQPAQVSLDNLI